MRKNCDILFRMRKKILFIAVLSLVFSSCAKAVPNEPELLFIFKEAYPDIVFRSEYDAPQKDWKISFTQNGKEYVFFWNNGSFLPEKELSAKEKYWTLLYSYGYKIPPANPADFTEEQIRHLRQFGSNENRRNGAGTPMFFFDAVYDSSTRENLEKHISQIRFLGSYLNIHERLIQPLKKVESRIYEAAENDDEIAEFIRSLKTNSGYYWRVIANTNRKSFHSLGIAVDIQPKSYGGKEVYWSWAKDRNPAEWMMTPLEKRWMPPQKVVNIFEEEGFIWGGKWSIWDNMHFEYHPELIRFAQFKARQ